MGQLRGFVAGSSGPGEKEARGPCFVTAFIADLLAVKAEGVLQRGQKHFSFG